MEKNISYWHWVVAFGIMVTVLFTTFLLLDNISSPLIILNILLATTHGYYGYVLYKIWRVSKLNHLK